MLLRTGTRGSLRGSCEARPVAPADEQLPTDRHIHRGDRRDVNCMPRACFGLADTATDTMEHMGGKD